MPKTDLQASPTSQKLSDSSILKSRIVSFAFRHVNQLNTRRHFIVGTREDKQLEIIKHDFMHYTDKAQNRNEQTTGWLLIFVSLLSPLNELKKSFNSYKKLNL